MSKVFAPYLYVIIILFSSFLYSLVFENYVYIPVDVYLQIAFSVTFIVILFSLFFKNRGIGKIDFGINRIDLFLFAFIAYYLIRYCSSAEYRILTNELLVYLILFISYYYLKSTKCNKHKIIKNVISIIITAGTIQCIYGLMQQVGILPIYFTYKLGGSFMNPGELANFLCIPYALLLGLLFYETDRRKQYLYLILFLLHLLVIIVSFARTAWIACFVVSVVTIYYFKLRHTNVFNALIHKKKVVFLLCILLLVISQLIISKLYLVKEASADGRIFIWKLSTQVIMEKPIFGQGYESFVSTIRKQQIEYFAENPNDTKSGWLAGEPMFAFNDFLQLTIEFGIIGLLLFLFLLRSVFKVRQSNIPEQEQKLLFILKATLFSILVCMLFSFSFQNRSILFCSFVIFALISRFDEDIIFNINIKKLYLYLTYTVLILGTGYLAIYSSKTFYYSIKWREASKNATLREGDFRLQYDEVYKYLKHEPSFLINYGFNLYQSGNYQECITHIEKYAYLFKKTDMYIMLGNAYELLKQLDKAEESFKKATYLVPHKFIPKYRLFKLYEQTNQNSKALDIALYMRNMKIKVYSEDVKTIKTEINKYIIQHRNLDHDEKAY